jgi:hypothetical protein
MYGHSQPESPSRKHNKGLGYRWMVVIVAIFGTLMSAFDKTITNIAIPPTTTRACDDGHTRQRRSPGRSHWR